MIEDRNTLMIIDFLCGRRNESLLFVIRPLQYQNLIENVIYRLQCLDVGYRVNISNRTIRANSNEVRFVLPNQDIAGYNMDAYYFDELSTLEPKQLAYIRGRKLDGQD